MTAGAVVNVIQHADNLVHGRQDDFHVSVTAGDNSVSQRIGVSQGLGLAVAACVLVGDQDGLDALLLLLDTVHDQVSVGVAEAFFGNDDSIQIQQLSQLSSPVGATLLVSQVDVLVGDDVADVVQRLAVLFEQFSNNGVVQVMVGGVLVGGLMMPLGS